MGTQLRWGALPVGCRQLRCSSGSAGARPIAPVPVGVADIESAREIVRRFISPAPLIRSYKLEAALGFVPATAGSDGRRVWLKDYGWTPSGSFKLMGALNWVAHHAEEIGDRPVAAHSSGNFASGLAFAGAALGKRVVVVMPDTAPRVKFDLTASFGAEVLTYDIATDHATGVRDRLTREVADERRGVEASPYNDPHVIAGAGVGGLEICEELTRAGRALSHFVCQVSGGGLMAGHAVAVAHSFPRADVIGVEPTTANDFELSLAAGERVRVERPSGICDGLLSYDVGEHNWPLLRRHVTRSVTVPDADTKVAMRWLYKEHGVVAEPSGAIGVAALLTGKARVDGDGDVVVVVSGRNVDESSFARWIAEAGHACPVSGAGLP